MLDLPSSLDGYRPCWEVLAALHLSQPAWDVKHTACYRILGSHTALVSAPIIWPACYIWPSCTCPMACPAADLDSHVLASVVMHLPCI